jgi:hypothetical protein
VEELPSLYSGNSKRLKRRAPGTFSKYLRGSFIAESLVGYFKHRSGDVGCKSAVYILHCSRQFILLIQMTLDVLCRGI